MSNYMIVAAFLAAISPAVGQSAASVPTNKPWPHIENFEHRYHFDSPSQMYLTFPIRDIQGHEVYIVECASPFAKNPNVAQFSWSRDFECRVAVPGAVLLPDIQLLANSADITKEWQSRGGFLWSELTPKCSVVPGWGAKRTYRFRGMSMTINITDVNLVKNVEHSRHLPLEKLEGLTVTISGKADSKATKAYGGATSYREPPLRSASEEYGFLACE